MFARLLLLFILVPLIEVYLFRVIGRRIGPGATIAIVIFTGVLGASLTRRQGLQTLNRFQTSLQEGRLPHEELLEGLMILLAGAFLLTPGFLTDTVGFLLLVPPLRTLFRQLLGGVLKRRIQVSGIDLGGSETGTSEPRSPTSRQGPGPVIDGEVIEGEVMDER